MQQHSDTLKQMGLPNQPQHQPRKKALVQKQKRKCFFLPFYLLFFTLSSLTGSAVWAQSSQDIELQVGVVQRFGEKPKDRLTLKATPGDRLSLRFNQDGLPQILEATELKLEIQMQPLPQPVVEERVVLGSYRSFESAEDTANKWRAKGLEVEIGQPDEWQVWAKRGAYSSPLIRRFLLESLQAQGHNSVYLDTKILQQTPQASWVVNGTRYSQSQLDISAGTGLIKVEKGKEQKTERLYGGSLRLQPNAYGTYTLVNQVPLETYLRGVVPHEIGEEAPYPAIEAQTILARTYVLRNVRRFAIDNYQMCANTQCQVYLGLGDTWPDADRAIAATTGQVLVYQNELIDALYSSTSGGVTAPFNDMWNGPERPYLLPVLDSVGNVWDLSSQSLASEDNFRRFVNIEKGFNEEGDLFRWREESSLDKMNKDLKRYLQDGNSALVNFQTIQELRVLQRSSAGRVLKMAVITDGGVLELEKDEILRAFYAPLSTLFYVEPIYQENTKILKGYAFIGGGFGHGVGMSQTGSHKLAKLGWSSERILSFYYPGTQIQPINESIILWQDPLKEKSEEKVTLRVK
ncbi:SpoIID/LytB domain-containing protein [Microcoleus sp. FACHB-672]|uniref:SpoIID/LytB domain-containing protein n=1 Tax=Microcoleus sp. FACHB-672 TaxID=2692825 RepID=UPI0016880BD8|nr:SpoIID/LytB domain-containing protein [Microcoleus sp. FACHB-672]MBD2042881.1 SpoIID/LytB domain-containing protein [Microcoleus sp. FACHB-672]